MRRLKIIAFFALLVLIGIGATASAQMSGTTHGATPVGIVGGGGNSSSTNYVLSGGTPLGAGGVSSGTGYVTAGGVPAIQIGTLMAGLSTEYVGASYDTFTVTNRTLKVAYSGGEGTATGTFYYRSGGALTFQSAAMAAGTGDTLVFQVTGSHLTARGLEYYFAITRGAEIKYQGSAASPFIAVVSMTNAQCQRPDALPEASYRIIGLPVDPLSGAVAVVFPDDLGDPDPIQWRLGSYDAALDSVLEYPNAAAVEPGQGYWLIARGGKRYGVAGHSMRPNRSYGGSDYFEVPLDSGWNQFANPLPFDISWAEILFDDNGTVVAGHPNDVLDDAAYHYNGSSYQQITTIDGWNGVFIFIKKTGIKAFARYREASKKAPVALKQLPVNPSFDNWSIHLELASQGLIDDGNIMGVNTEATDKGDHLDLAEPPPAPGAPRLAFRISDEASYLRRVDLREPYTDGAIWHLEFNSAPDRILTASGIDQIPDGMEAWLVLDNASAIQMTEESLELADNVMSARLIISNKEYLVEEADVNLPLQYTLNQNYPNPFNGATNISFTVEKPGLIVLGVYNIIGQRIKTLVNTEMGIGEYTVNWDGTDENGSEVASGIYFYRIEAGDFNRCRKMLFLK